MLVLHCGRDVMTLWVEVNTETGQILGKTGTTTNNQEVPYVDGLDNQARSPRGADERMWRRYSS